MNALKPASFRQRLTLVIAAELSRQRVGSLADGGSGWIKTVVLLISNC